MDYRHITDAELLTMTSRCSASIREKTLELLEMLTEIDKRKLYCDLSFSSLFNYIVNELKFSESQAAIYNNIIKANILSLPLTKDKIEDGTLSLFAAGAAARIIRDEQITNVSESIKIIKKLEVMTKEEIKNELPPKTKKKFAYSKEILDKVAKLKKKLNLPNDMEIEAILILLLDRELTSPAKSEIKENKTITPQTKTRLKLQAKHQCEFVSESKVRCTETKHLEVDHIKPKALNGSNHPNNLRILCRNHNQRAAIKNLGQHSVFKRTSPVVNSSKLSIVVAAAPTPLK